MQTEVTIISCLTNFITNSLSDKSSDGDLQQLLRDVFVNDGGVFGFCNTFPHVRVFIAPPNVRMRPQWYVRLRPSVIRAFHQVLEMAPVNLQAIEDFQGDFEQDQVHFTCLSGIYYVQHLADRVLSMLEVPAPAKQVRYIVPSDLILLVCFIDICIAVQPWDLSMRYCPCLNFKEHLYF